MRGEYLKQKHLWEQQMTCMELAKNKVKKNSTPGHKIKGKATPRVWAKMQRNSHTKVNIIITHAAYQPLLDPKLWSIKWLNCIISSVQPVYPLRMQFYTKLTSLKSIHLPQQWVNSSNRQTSHGCMSTRRMLQHQLASWTNGLMHMYKARQDSNLLHFEGNSQSKTTYWNKATTIPKHVATLLTPKKAGTK